MSNRFRSRRRVLAAGASWLALGLGGCLSGDGGGDASESPFEGDPPELADPVLGTDGPLVEVYADYACPHCHTFELQVRPGLDDLARDGELRLRHRDFPIPVDETWSWRMPNLPRSAQAQTGSVETFRDVNRYVWEHWNDGRFDEAYVREVARAFDLEADRTVQAVRHERYRSAVEADRQRGVEAGVRGTPGVVVDGEVLEDVSLERIREAVEAASD